MNLHEKTLTTPSRNVSCADTDTCHIKNIVQHRSRHPQSDSVITNARRLASPATVPSSTRAWLSAVNVPVGPPVTVT
jgi:hypothetical protein